MPKAQKLNDKKNKIVGNISLKDNERKRKQVFKPILDNPYTQSNLWPYVEPETGQNILELLANLLAPIGRFNKASRSIQQPESRKHLKSQAPEVSQHVTVGFNSTVKALEIQASHHRAQWKRKPSKEKKKTEESKYIKYVFVTKYDITSALLTNPFPVLSVTSSRTRDDRVKLIQLPRGSMARISESLNVENTGFIGLSNDFEEAKPLYSLIDENIKDTQVPWLEPLFDGSSKFERPALKFLITSAPVINKKQQKKATNATK